MIYSILWQLVDFGVMENNAILYMLKLLGFTTTRAFSTLYKNTNKYIRKASATENASYPFDIFS